MFWQEKEAGSKRCITQSNVTHKAWPEQSAAATLQLWAALSSLARATRLPGEHNSKRERSRGLCHSGGAGSSSAAPQESQPRNYRSRELRLKSEAPFSPEHSHFFLLSASENAAPPLWLRNNPVESFFYRLVLKIFGKICYLERLEASVALLSSSDTWDLIPNQLNTKIYKY